MPRRSTFAILMAKVRKKHKNLTFQRKLRSHGSNFLLLTPCESSRKITKKFVVNSQNTAQPPLNLHQTSTKIRQMPSFSVIAMKDLDKICDTIHTNTKGVTIKNARFTPETHRFTIKTHGVTIETHCFTPETHGFSLKFSRKFNPYSWTFV